jgi:hypothetical protein
MSLKSFLLNSLFITSSIMGTAGIASAENLVPLTAEDGTVYQIDLDDRVEVESPSSSRNIKFWLSTEGDDIKHEAIASCEPYQLKSEFYDLDWLDDSEQSYSEDSVPGAIARLACGD